MRLQKYMALCGVASRRKSEEIIKQGRVFVNGIKVLKMGTEVAATDKITVDGQCIKPESNKVYIMLNKPAGYITSVSDQFGRKTVLNLIGGITERIYPVGRLDYETEGLILLTNDGDFSNILTHPKHEIQKEYYVEVGEELTTKSINLLEKGVDIGGFTTSPASLIFHGKKKNKYCYNIIIHEGKNRQVRRMFCSVGTKVLYLKRVRIGNLSLDIQTGNWRDLKKQEINSLLKNF